MRYAAILLPVSICALLGTICMVLQLANASDTFGDWADGLVEWARRW